MLASILSLVLIISFAICSHLEIEMALTESKSILHACDSLKNSTEPSPEFDNYMETILYFCMMRTIELLVNVKKFDENIKGNLFNFQAEVQNVHHAQEISTGSDHQETDVNSTVQRQKIPSQTGLPRILTILTRPKMKFRSSRKKPA